MDTLTDEADGSCGDGDCSLRDAIALANSNVGPDTIDFSVAGTITVDASLGCLPFLEDGGTTIDGTSAPGYVGTPLVAITAGVGLSCNITAGIYIDSNDNTLTGLAIYSFADECIDIDGGSGNVIGPDMVMSDCYWGLNMGGPAEDNVIQESFIGTNLDGDAAWGNVGAGIYLNHGPQVGGPTSTQILDNVISGNLGYGILLFGQNTQQNQIKGNYIGVAADGVSPLGNGSAGIFVEYGSHDNYIGGSLEGDGNVIAYNASMHPRHRHRHRRRGFRWQPYSPQLHLRQHRPRHRPGRRRRDVRQRSIRGRAEPLHALPGHRIGDDVSGHRDYLPQLHR